MINILIAHLECQCGEKFQMLNVDGTDWDETATAVLYQKHLLICGGVRI